MDINNINIPLEYNIRFTNQNKNNPSIFLLHGYGSNMNDLFTKLNDVQNGLASVHSLDLERLAGITTNPDHPFFLDEGETYRD